MTKHSSKQIYFVLMPNKTFYCEQPPKYYIEYECMP